VECCLCVVVCLYGMLVSVYVCVNLLCLLCVCM